MAAKGSVASTASVILMVCLSCKGDYLNPAVPSITVDPTELEFVVAAEYSALDSLIVHNTGESPLHVTSIFDNAEWLLETPTSFELDVNASEKVWVEVDATGLSPGNHEARMTISSDDPDSANVVIEVRLTVTESLLSMVFVPGGTFQMGSSNEWAYDWEMPVHDVTVSSFYISRYEVTQAQYEQFDPEHKSWFVGSDLPVERVRWFDAVRFCNWLSQREGYESFYDQEDLLNEVDDVRMNWEAEGYRLPSEAEWEYACRAGTSTDFHSGDLTHPNCEPLDQNLDAVGWYCGNADSMTHEVGEREPNNLGLFDMSGNVWEWCNDWYRNDYYHSTPDVDPPGPPNGMLRVSRGGSWGSSARTCRSANRDDFTPGPGGSDLGFRPVRRVN